MITKQQQTTFKNEMAKAGLGNNWLARHETTLGCIVISADNGQSWRYTAQQMPDETWALCTFSCASPLSYHGNLDLALTQVWNFERQRARADALDKAEATVRAAHICGAHVGVQLTRCPVCEVISLKEFCAAKDNEIARLDGEVKKQLERARNYCKEADEAKKARNHYIDEVTRLRDLLFFLQGESADTVMKELRRVQANHAKTMTALDNKSLELAQAKEALLARAGAVAGCIELSDENARLRAKLASAAEHCNNFRLEAKLERAKVAKLEGEMAQTHADIKAFRRLLCRGV